MKNLLTIVAFLTACIFSSGAIAALDMFFVSDDFRGESLDHEFNGDIDVLAWSMSPNLGSTAKKRRQCVTVNLTKYIDKASPHLLISSVSGESFGSASLIVRKAGGDRPSVQLELALIDFRISSYSTGGSGGEDRLTENVSVSFNQATMTYTPSNDDGTPGQQVVSTITNHKQCK